jgi:hypothetical protein
MADTCERVKKTSLRFSTCSANFNQQIFPMKKIFRIKATVMTVAAAAVLVACGGGGGGEPVSNSATISGVASKGPLNGATVCAYAIVANIKSDALGTCATNIANGNYSIDIGSYRGPVLVEASGGAYKDEATGLTVSLSAPLHSIVANASGGAINLAVTPLTEMAYQDAASVAAGLTTARIQSAIAKVQAYFGVADIVNTLPVDALNIPADATLAQKTYALALATVSQYQHSQPSGTSLSDTLLSIKTCLANPATGCSSGTANVGTALAAAQTAFKLSHPDFSSVTLPVATFGPTSITSADPTSGSSGSTSAEISGATASQFFVKNAIGNKWTYSYTTNADGGGTGTSSETVTAFSSGVVTKSQTVTPTGVSPINGGTSMDRLSSGAWISTNISTGTQTVLPANFTVGTTWEVAPTVTTTITGGISQTAITGKIIAMNVTRTVPAGTFTDCLKVITTSSITYQGVTGLITEEFYFSPTAGNAVEVIQSTTSPNTVATFQLQPGYVAN